MVQVNLDDLDAYANIGEEGITISFAADPDLVIDIGRSGGVVREDGRVTKEMGRTAAIMLMGMLVTAETGAVQNG